MAKPKNGEPVAAAAAPREVHRPLGGAAKAAHEAKIRGERVSVPARSRSSSSSTPAAPAAKRAGILERIARII